MISLKNFTLSLISVLFTLVLFLNSCSEKSEYGDASDYEKKGASDLNSPTISSVSPADNSTGVAVSTTIVATFSEKMSTGSVTTNTSDTTCSGSFQLSSDNFTTCVKMSAAPSASNSDKTFTSTPADNLSISTTYRLRITTSVKDSGGNTLAEAYTTNGFTTTGSSVIRGRVLKESDNSGLPGVSVRYTISGTTGDSTTDSSGDYSFSSLSAGNYTLSYSISNYDNASQAVTLATDNETKYVTPLKMLSTSECASSATVSGTITDSTSSSITVSGVSMSFREGVNNTSGTADYTATTDGSGDYSLTMNRGWYTVQTSVSNYIDSTFYVLSCGNQSGQNSSISKELSSNSMRIVLSWPAGSTATDLDSHLQIPDNASSTFHVYYPSANKTFYYSTNSATCSGCDTSDNVTLDRDENAGTGAPPGTETISIANVKSGETYSYSVHDYTNGYQKDNASSTKLGDSGATVTIYYGSNTPEIITVPIVAGTLWRVFTFTDSGGVQEEESTLSHLKTPSAVY